MPVHLVEEALVSSAGKFRTTRLRRKAPGAQDFSENLSVLVSIGQISPTFG